MNESHEPEPAEFSTFGEVARVLLFSAVMMCGVMCVGGAVGGGVAWVIALCLGKAVYPYVAMGLMVGAMAACGIATGGTCGMGRRPLPAKHAPEQ